MLYSQIMKQRTVRERDVRNLNQSLLNNVGSLVDVKNQQLIASQIGIYQSLPKEIFQKFIGLDLGTKDKQKKVKQIKQTFEQIDGKIVIYFHIFKKRISEEIKLIDSNQLQSVQDSISRLGKRKCVLDIISQFIKEKMGQKNNQISNEKYKLMRYSGTFVYKIIPNELNPISTNQMDLFKQQIFEMQRKFDSVFNDKGFSFRYVLFLKFVKFFPNQFVFFYQDIQTIFIFADQIQDTINGQKAIYYQRRVNERLKK